MFNILKLAVASAICVSIATSAAASTDAEREAKIERAVAQDKQKPDDKTEDQCEDEPAADRDQSSQGACSEEPFDQAKTKLHAERILAALTAPAVIVRIKVVNVADEEQR